jgi:hypothetical protein
MLALRGGCALIELLEDRERFDWLFNNCQEVRELVGTVVVHMDDETYRIEVCKFHSTPPSYTSRFQVKKVIRGWKGTEEPIRAWIDADVPPSTTTDPEAALAMAVGLLRERKK